MIVTSSDELPPQCMRELSWSLEPGRQHLVVAPSFTDIGSPRTHMRPVAVLPRGHLETPRYEELQRFSKWVFDVVESGGLIMLLSLFLALIAMGVRPSTPGPVLFRQERVGLNGRPLDMLKFRSTVVDAEGRLGTRRSGSCGGQHRDVQDAGRLAIDAYRGVLRRFSPDELPQLWNVFRGSMSLVDPARPSIGRLL